MSHHDEHALQLSETRTLAWVCLQRNKNTNQISDSTSDVSVDSTAGIDVIKNEISEKYMITVNIENKKVQMEFDTGATHRPCH